MSDKKKRAQQVIELLHEGAPSLFERGMLTSLMKTADPTGVENSSVESDYGRVPHPLDFKQMENIREFNVDHSSCLVAKVNSTTGLGHKNEKIYDTLDPLTNFTWQSVLDSACGDYWEKGVGMIEVVRGPGGQITGLHHLPVKYTWVFYEGNNQWHYEVESPATVQRDGVQPFQTKKLARFGDLEGLKQRAAATDMDESLIVDSEVILVPSTGNKRSFYGDVDWLCGVPTMELVQATTQEEFDFHWNRSVPEFLLFILGSVSDDVMEEIKTALASNVGPGNTHKSVIAALQGASKETHEIFFEQLGVRGAQESKFTEEDVGHSLKICSAHGMPALLAGIQVPGKMAAANELPNALAAFQLLKIAPAQKLWSRILACTLGKEGGLGLTSKDFLEAEQTEEEKLMGKKPNKMNGFYTITDELNLDSMDTMARMREPVTGSDRDPSKGLLERGGDRNKVSA